MKQHKSPTEALAAYRKVVPQRIVEAAQAFVELPTNEQAELLFYMTVSQANVITVIAQSMDLEVDQVGEVADGEKAN